MQQHNLKRNSSNRKSRQVGRGSSRGKTSGRGTKGQNARAGHKKRPEMRDIIKRIPKLRGRGKNSLKSIQEKPLILNLVVLDKNFKAGETVTLASLKEKGMVSIRNGKLPKIKILGSGKVTKAINVELPSSISLGARKAIEEAGGKLKLGYELTSKA